MNAETTQGATVHEMPANAVSGNGSAASGGVSRTPTIHISHLNRFFGQLKAVNNVSFEAFAGQVVGFIGP